MCVIAINAPFLLYPNETIYPPLYQWFMRLAVPFFFITSGFLTKEHLKDVQYNTELSKILFSKSLKLFKLFFNWIIIYLPISLYFNRSELGNASFWNQYFSSIIYNGESQYAYPLWYIYSMAIVFSIIAALIYCRVRVRFVFLLSILIAFCNYLYENLDLSDLATFHTLTHRTLGGGIYLTAGMLISDLLEKKVFHSLLYSSFALPIYLIVSITGYYFHLPFWELIGGIVIFLISFNIKHTLWNHDMTIRNISMWVYYTHMYILVALMMIKFHINIDLNGWVLLILATLISIVTSYGLSRFQLREGFKRISLLVR